MIVRRIVELEGRRSEIEIEATRADVESIDLGVPMEGSFECSSVGSLAQLVIDTFRGLEDSPVSISIVGEGSPVTLDSDELVRKLADALKVGMGS